MTGSSTLLLAFDYKTNYNGGLEDIIIFKIK